MKRSPEVQKMIDELSPEDRAKVEGVFAQQVELVTQSKSELLQQIDNRFNAAFDNAVYTPLELSYVRYFRELAEFSREAGDMAQVECIEEKLKEIADKKLRHLDRKHEKEVWEKEKLEKRRLELEAKMERLLDQKIKLKQWDLKDRAALEKAKQAANRLAHLMFDGLMERYIPADSVVSMGEPIENPDGFFMRNTEI